MVLKILVVDLVTNVSKNIIHVDRWVNQVNNVIRMINPEIQLELKPKSQNKTQKSIIC